MGVFDQATRYAAQAAPDAVICRVLAPTGIALPFRAWLDTRTIPLPGGPERTADLVAALDDPAAEQPWLLLFEFQAQHDPDKLDVTLEEAGILRGHARHGDDRKGKYQVLTALVYLQGRCPVDVLAMTMPGGYGTRHAPLVWNVAADDALATVEAVAAGKLSWGMLFWVALMAGTGNDGVLARWRDVVTATVEDRRVRANLAIIALVFSELAGRGQEWKRGLEGFMWTESQFANELISQGLVQGKRDVARKHVLDVLNRRFPGAVSGDVVKLVNQQESVSLLDDWFQVALAADTFEQFMNALKGA